MGTDSHRLSTPLPTLARESTPSEVLRARWARLADDFSRLSLVDRFIDVGELLLRGHDDALAEAERYVVMGHTIRTGHVVEFDDIDDEESLVRWATELDASSKGGWAPPVPEGFWASFLRWRTPLGMARLTDRRIRAARA